MSKEILINIKEKTKRIAVVKNNLLEEFYLEVSSEESILGNIYKGIVRSVVPSIDAAFIDIGQGKNGFLYLGELTNPLVEEELKEQVPKFDIYEKKDNANKYKVGDEVLVQVVKEAFGTKGPRLTTHISLPGRYLVLMPLDRNIGISRRISDHKERDRLRSTLEKINFLKNMGIIVRTVAQGKGNRELIRDGSFLVKTWRDIRKRNLKQKPPSPVHKEYGILLKVLRDVFSEDVEKVIIDSKREYINVFRFVRTYLGGHFARKIKFYREGVPLFEFKNVEDQIKKLYEKKVFLKSGAYIVIEPTEGLTVIDVNSGRFTSKANPEKAAFMVNLEAAREAARQLRLRDIGGIVVIDFIDMVEESNQRQVLYAFKEALSQDRAKTDVLGISKLGLVEMTRERTSRSIESKYYKICPACEGRGKLKID
ncbi:MAG: Rne/Rng family ribonuclease [Candidatus Omnitrophica bacterium]|nr:Rne/Rng family ribonuclease [Candidatus Omnitrophota bacterium]HOX54200.1 Rne/Rng family ribonuclease [Candidatus Omnitrophota bacterium]